MTNRLTITLLVLVLAMLAAVALAQQAPKVEVTTDSGSYHFGDTAEVLLSVTNGDTQYSVDFYMALIAPDGAPYFFPGWTHAMQPGMSGIVLPPDFAIGPFVFLTCPIPGGAPPILSEGAFIFAAAFAGAGSGELIQDISFAYFDTIASSPSCPDGMMRIPEGPFLMGDTSGFGYLDEYPLHEVFLDAFCMDVYEYPNQASAIPSHGLTWVEADALCVSLGKRLCTEAEWEKACKGPMGYVYPYGDIYNDVLCWTSMGYNDGAPEASGGRSRCTTPYGLFDMSGNAWEWVGDFYDAEYYSSSPNENPTGPDLGAAAVMRGGAWFHSGLATRCSFRGAYSPEGTIMGAGARCCSD